MDLGIGGAEICRHGNRIYGNHKEIRTTQVEGWIIQSKIRVGKCPEIVM